MKKLRRVAWCFSIAQLFFCPSLGHAMNVTLGWEPNTESHLAGYKVYYDTNSGTPYAPALEDRADNYPDGTPIVVDKSVSEITLTGLTDGKVYYFAVTAFDDEGRESTFSNEVATDTEPPGTVTNLSREAVWRDIPWCGIRTPVPSPIQRRTWEGIAPALARCFPTGKTIGFTSGPWTGSDTGVRPYTMVPFILTGIPPIS
jgi:hypothetical protein